MLLYKCLAKGKGKNPTSPHGFSCQNEDGTSSTDWDLPVDGQPGKWKETKDRLNLHHSGIHLTPAGTLINWLNDRTFEVETEGEIQKGTDGVVARKVRLLEEVELLPQRAFQLAIGWVHQVIDVPTWVGYSHPSYQFVLNLSFSQAVGMIQRNDPKALKNDDAIRVTFKAVDDMIKYETQYARSTTEFQHNCEAVVSAAKAVKLLGTMSADPMDHLKSIAFHAREVVGHCIRTVETRRQLGTLTKQCRRLPNEVLSLAGMKHRGWRIPMNPAHATQHMAAEQSDQLIHQLRTRY